MGKLRVGIYGATGSVGLEAIGSLLNHPQFEISHLYASEKSAGKPYKDACPLDVSSLPESISGMVVEPTRMDTIPLGIDIAFFALPEEISKEYELTHAPEFAKRMTVITTSSALRMDEKVPLIITEVNPGHVQLAEDYRREYGSRGAIFPQCNCTAVPLVLSLRPLQDTLGIEAVFMDSYQSVSGAGAKAVVKWKGERSMNLPEPFQASILEPGVVYDCNVRPIGVADSREEERKVVGETLKMLGRYENDRIIPADFEIDCMCNRVPTLRGHFEHIRIKPRKSCNRGDVISIYGEFNETCREMYGKLPSSPEKTLVVLDRQPQTRHDVGFGDGMSTVIGDIEVRDGWIKLRALSDNLAKGAAKGSVQLMEYLKQSSFF